MPEVPLTVDGVSAAVAMTYIAYVRFCEQAGEEVEEWLDEAQVADAAAAAAAAGDNSVRASASRTSLTSVASQTWKQLAPSVSQVLEQARAQQQDVVLPGVRALAASASQTWKQLVPSVSQVWQQAMARQASGDDVDDDAGADAESNGEEDEPEPDVSLIEADVRKLVQSLDQTGKAGRIEAMSSFMSQVTEARSRKAKAALVRTLHNEQGVQMLLKVLQDRDPSVQAAALASIEGFVTLCVDAPGAGAATAHAVHDGRHQTLNVQADASDAARAAILHEFLREGLDVLLQVMSAKHCGEQMQVQMVGVLLRMAAGNRAALKYLANNGALNVLTRLLDESDSAGVRHVAFQAVSLLRSSRLQYRLDVAGGIDTGRNRTAASSMAITRSARDAGNAHTLHWHSDDPSMRARPSAADDYASGRVGAGAVPVPSSRKGKEPAEPRVASHASGVEDAPALMHAPSA